MVRPGPKTTQEEVRTAVVNLLGNYPEGISFNEIFKKLKNKKVLGSYSVLSRALQDLLKANVINYEEKPTKAKIPRRVYILIEPKVREFIQSYVKAKEKEKIPLKMFVTEESLLKHLFFVHINNLLSAYRSLLHEENPLDDQARWKLFLNMELNYMQVFMESVAKAVSEGQIPVDDAEKAASEVQIKILQCF